MPHEYVKIESNFFFLDRKSDIIVCKKCGNLAFQSIENPSIIYDSIEDCELEICRQIINL